MKKKFKIVICLLVIIVILVVGYFIGYKRAYDKIENANQDINQETFYAEIKDINNTSILVDGLLVNDINFRGQFDCSIVKETKLVWRGTDIELSDLDIGDNISITFEGMILESNPAQIHDVVKIQLLEDEK